MRKAIIGIALVAILGLFAWGYFGGIERVTAGRIESVLVDKGISQPVAACMGIRMAERLSLNQLRKLENLRAEDGEAVVPLSIAELLERVRRVGDSEVLEVAASSAAVCAFAGR